MTVRAINLFEEDCPIQYDLFTDVKSLDRQERLDAAIEQIRFRFGKDAIKNGVLFQKSKMPTERKVDLVNTAPVESGEFFAKRSQHIRRFTEEERRICRNRNVEKYMYL